jgi:hypothetical protein
VKERYNAIGTPNFTRVLFHLKYLHFFQLQFRTCPQTSVPQTPLNRQECVGLMGYILLPVTATSALELHPSLSRFHFDAKHQH